MKRLFLSSQFSDVIDTWKEIVPIGGMSVAFVTTAADPYEEKPWLVADREALVASGYDVLDYDLKGKTDAVIYGELKDMDIIFIAGGNTFYLLKHMRESGFDRAVERLVEEGAWYVGSSAGSVVAGPTLAPIVTLDDPQEVPDLTDYRALGFTNTIILPHYGKDKYKELIDPIIEEWGEKLTLMTLTDEQAVVVEGDDVRRV